MKNLLFLAMFVFLVGCDPNHSPVVADTATHTFQPMDETIVQKLPRARVMRYDSAQQATDAGYHEGDVLEAAKKYETEHPSP